MEVLKQWAERFMGTVPGEMLRNAFTGRELSAPLRRSAHLIVALVFAAVIVLSLLESLARRAGRKEKLPQLWRGRSRPAAAILAFILGPLGVHRFYMGFPVTALCQIVGTLSFVYGAWLLGNSTFFSFLFIKEEVIMGLLFFLSGMAVQLWHFRDFFMILFGGMVPRGKGRRTIGRERKDK